MEKNKIPMIGIVGLVIGNLVGAGILALPISLGITGIMPALVSMTIYTIMMFFTADILSCEAAEMKQETFDYPSLYHKYLGNFGKWIAIITNAIILYGVLVAYISGGSQIISNAIGLPSGSILITVIFSIILVALTLFDLSVINKYNTFLIIFLFLTFGAMIFYSYPYINVEHFQRFDLKYIGLTFPLVIMAAHFHNIIPRLCHDLDWNTKALRKAMLWGMFLAFIMNVLWTLCGIGCLEFAGDNSIVNSYLHSYPATVPMSIVLKSKAFIILGATFSIIAISTSFFANGAGLQNFIRDLFFNTFKIQKMFVVRIVTFIPPLIVAYLWPEIFIKALNVAGGVGIVTLFGILPCVLAIMKKNTKKRIKILGWFFLILSIIALITTICILFNIGGFNDIQQYLK